MNSSVKISEVGKMDHLEVEMIGEGQAEGDGSQYRNILSVSWKALHGRLFFSFFFYRKKAKD